MASAVAASVISSIMSDTLGRQSENREQRRLAAKPKAPTVDDPTSRRAAQRRRARGRVGAGRVGTMLSSDTLG